LEEKLWRKQNYIKGSRVRGRRALRGFAAAWKTPLGKAQVANQIQP